MSEEKFEKRRKGVEILLDIIFIFNLIALFVMGIYKVSYLTGKASIDMFTNKEIVIHIITTIFLYVSTRLAHKGHILAGFIGIFIAITEILLAGIIWKFVGILLLIDSIVYFVEYKKA